MLRTLLAAFLLALAARAEVHTMTLKDAVALALTQNPELTIARLDEQKAQLGVKIAGDPFVPKVFAGSGLAYTYGFPQSIDGAAPSIVQARGVMSVFNKQQTYQLAQAKQNARGANIETGRKQEEIAYRTAALFLDAESAAQIAEMQRKQVDSLERVQETVVERVRAGRELPIEGKRAALNVAKAKQRMTALESDRDNFEMSLATVLGFDSGDRVRPLGEDRERFSMPASEDQTLEEALRSNKELKSIESQMQSKGLEAKSFLAQRLPKLDLVAQYGLFGRFNRFEDYFNRFQRHNAQIGVSVTVPLVVGPAARAYASQSELEITRLRTQAKQARSRITEQIRQSYSGVRKAEASRDVAKLDLEVAREQLAIVLARQEEGRAAMKDLEEARIAENEKWIAYFQAVSMLERARLDVLRESGSLAASLR